MSSFVIYIRVTSRLLLVKAKKVFPNGSAPGSIDLYNKADHDYDGRRC